MQTSLYKITFKDGRIYNVFCSNRKQNQDMLHFLTRNSDEIKIYEVVERGIHTMLYFKKLSK